MKKTIIIISVLFTIAFLNSCFYQSEVSMKAQSIFYGEITADDNSNISAINNDYSIKELKDFFQPYHIDQLANVKETLNINQANEQFPIELTRSKGYSIYKVSEGGVYYVFWIHSLVDGVPPILYFSAYSEDMKKETDFENIKIGNSTAKDVLIVDPNLEFNFMLSSGVYSYSFLKNDMILKIKYTQIGSALDKKNLIVESIEIEKRENSESLFSEIYLMDLTETV